VIQKPASGNIEAVRPHGFEHLSAVLLKHLDQHARGDLPRRKRQREDAANASPTDQVEVGTEGLPGLLFDQVNDR
jgi:hypothetical protein